ncbi:MAG: hypothetical protein HUJ31_01555, partial [Pseudomonadales bacterium]|nr:hypothetical protein [Pseudomonadales bacterium]
MKFKWSAWTFKHRRERQFRLIIAAFTALVVSTAITGCGQDETGEPPAPETVAVQPSPEVLDKWARSCALCHVNGEGGAPTMGQADEWEDRLEQGEAGLL